MFLNFKAKKRKIIIVTVITIFVIYFSLFDTKLS